MGFLESLRHAFATGPAGRAEPNETQQALIDRLCRQVIDRKLTTPALIFLESVRPLNYISAQALQFFSPLLLSIGGQSACEEFARFLEHRGAIDYLCQRLEELDAARPDTL